jgi:hypothetical protein
MISVGSSDHSARRAQDVIIKGVRLDRTSKARTSAIISSNLMRTMRRRCRASVYPEIVGQTAREARHCLTILGIVRARVAETPHAGA